MNRNKRGDISIRDERGDVSRYVIVAFIKMRKTSLAKLGEKHGYSKHTMKNALDKPCKDLEQVIAEVIGTTPEWLWPSRYQSKNNSIEVGE